jgi:hypothetical protein
MPIRRAPRPKHTGGLCCACSRPLRPYDAGMVGYLMFLVVCALLAGLFGHWPWKDEHYDE